MRADQYCASSESVILIIERKRCQALRLPLPLPANLIHGATATIKVEQDVDLALTRRDELTAKPALRIRRRPKRATLSATHILPLEGIA
jgi:hypothetical protein